MNGFIRFREDPYFVPYSGQPSKCDLQELVYKAYHVPSVFILDGVTSQMKPKGWANMLTSGSGWDPDIKFLLDGILHGFNMIDKDANVCSYKCKNYSSCWKGSNDENLTSLLNHEVKCGKLTKVNYEPKCVHAIGVINKKDSKKIRPIIDCKRPENISVNNHADQVLDTFKFVTIDMVTQGIREGKCFMSTIDLASAYRSIMINPKNREYFGLEYKGQMYVDNFICFGCKAAPYVFNRITDSVSRYLRDNGISCYNYLDDMICLSTTYEEGVRDQLFLIHTLRQLGFYIAWNKVQSPSRKSIYLGIEIDTVSGQLRLPQERLEKLRKELSFWSNKSKATEKQLQKLIGHLSHCARVIKSGKLYMYFLFKFLKESKTKRKIKLNKTFHQDLSWWSVFAFHYNYTPLLDPLNDAIWVSLFSHDEKVCVSGWDFESEIHIKPTMESLVGYTEKDNVFELYIPVNTAWDNTARELCALWVFLSCNEHLYDTTLFLFCLRKQLWLCLKKMRHKDEFICMVQRHIHWWTLMNNVNLEVRWKPLND